MRFLSLFSLSTLLSVTYATTLQGKGSITPQIYVGLPGAATHPPACGMPYEELNLNRITAVENMDVSSTCNLCLKVVNTEKPSKFVYVLAVDLGGKGLDLTMNSFEYLFGQNSNPSPASWTTVSSSYCAGIYTPGVSNPNRDLFGSSSSTNTHTSGSGKHATTTTKKAYHESN